MPAYCPDPPPGLRRDRALARRTDVYALRVVYVGQAAAVLATGSGTLVPVTAGPACLAPGGIGVPDRAALAPVLAVTITVTITVGPQLTITGTPAGCIGVGSEATCRATDISPGASVIFGGITVQVASSSTPTATFVQATVTIPAGQDPNASNDSDTRNLNVGSSPTG